MINKKHISLTDRIAWCHLVVFVAMLPYDRLYSELALISFCLHTIIHLTAQKIRMVFSYQTLILSSVFLITLVGILYSADKNQGIKDLQRQLAIVLFPLMLPACGLSLYKYRKSLLLVFAFTCVLAVVYLYVDALRIILYYKMPLSQLFSSSFINQNFSLPAGIHATYMGMYCLLSASILLYYHLRENDRRRRMLFALCFITLLAGVLQLASRAVFISAFFVALAFAFMRFRGTGRTGFILATVAIAAFAGIIILNIGSFKSRYISTLKDDLAETPVSSRVAEPRAIRWRLALGLIGKSPLYGFGSGSEKRLLKEAYFSHRLYVSYLNELNAHNQYISMAIKTGAWGLAAFLVTLFWGFAAAFRNRDTVFASFLVIVAIVSFSENILDVNKGIFFYAFFFALFAWSGKPFPPLFRLKRQVGNPLRENNSKDAAAVHSDNYVQ